MSVDVIFKHTVHSDLVYIAERMRQPDRDEVMAMSGEEPLAALITSKKMSEQTVTMTDRDGVPVLVFGFCARSLMSDSAVVWMLGTGDVVRHAKSVMIHTPKMLEIILEKYIMLENYVHVKNRVSVRWLKRLGFTMEEPFKHPISGEEFMHFYMERSQDV